MNGNYEKLAPGYGQKAEHLQRGSKKQKGLMTTARMGACMIRGNKTAKQTATTEEKECKLCEMKAAETETHLLLHCTRYNIERAIMNHSLNQGWDERQKKEFETAPDNQKRLCLLGMDFNNGNKEERANRDMAVKKFLEEINERRKRDHQCADLCGKAPAPIESSREEAELWTAEVRRALQELDEAGMWGDDEV